MSLFWFWSCSLSLGDTLGWFSNQNFLILKVTFQDDVNKVQDIGVFAVMFLFTEQVMTLKQKPYGRSDHFQEDSDLDIYLILIQQKSLMATCPSVSQHMYFPVVLLNLCQELKQ